MFAMRWSAILAIAIAGLIVVGGAVYFSVYQGRPASQSVTQNFAAPNNGDYICAKPALSSQYSCDQLPAGYQIPPKLGAGLQAYCPTEMTQSTCALLQKTYNNGVCDPNETAFTAPLDCACTGALVGDPYTGRCALPASVCQLAAAHAVQPEG